MNSTASPVPIEEMLAHRDWLRRIACALVGDPQSADDLTQEVWLTALEKPPTNRRSLRGWLATVLRRKAIDRSRASSRRARHEAGHVRPQHDRPADLLIGEIEMHKRVTDAVLALGDPYRSVLLLRYVADHAVPEVARLQDVPIATARTRLKRGLAQLRARLDVEHGGRRDAWMALLAPVAWPERAAVIASGASSAAVGGGIMGGKAAFVVGIGLVAIIAFWAVLGPTWNAAESGDPDAGTADVRGDAGAASDETEPRLRGHGGDAALAVRSGSAPATAGPGTDETTSPDAANGGPRGADLPSRQCAIRIVSAAGEPLSGRVAVRPLHSSRDGSSAATEHVIPADGVLRVVTRGVSFLRVAIDGRQTRHLTVEQGKEDESLDVVFGTGEVYGTVRDEVGLADAGVGVTLSTHLQGSEDGYSPSAQGSVFRMVASTDVNGMYRFTDLPTGSFSVVATRRRDDTAAERNIRSVGVVLEAGERVQVDFGGEDVEPLLSGVLRYADGFPVEKPVNMFLMLVGDGGRLYVATDKKGRFSQRVPRGMYDVEMVVSNAASFGAGMQLVPSSHRIVILDEGAPPQDVLFPGTRVEGHIRDFEGDGRQEVLAHLIEPEGEPPVSRISGRPVTGTRTVVAPDGTFRLDGLSPGLWRLSGSPRSIRLVEIRVESSQSVLPADLEFVDE